MFGLRFYRRLEHEVSAAMRTSLLTMVVVILLWAAPRLSSAEPKKPALTKEQQEQQAALIAEFRKTRTTPEKRLDVVERAARLSPYTLRACLDIVSKELRKPLADYRTQFMRAVSQAVAKRSTPADVQEITELRGKVLELAKREELNKEMIVSVSDPALARLKEIIVFKREDVFKLDAGLAKKREALFDLGRPWEKCVALLLEKLAEEESKKPADGEPRDEPPRPPTFEEYLVKEEEIAAALAVPMDAQTRSVLAANSQLAGRLEAEEARCVLDLNLTRNLLGLAPLRIDLVLAAAARDHSTDMESLHFFSHDSPVPGKATPFDRAQRAGTTASGENIALGMLDGAAANLAWWHSPGHHKNMLGNHARVGLGASGRYWTELFGR
jgi:uncharacterized protein YkwD